MAQQPTTGVHRSRLLALRRCLFHWQGQLVQTEPRDTCALPSLALLLAPASVTTAPQQRTDLT